MHAVLKISALLSLLIGLLAPAAFAAPSNTGMPQVPPRPSAVNSTGNSTVSFPAWQLPSGSSFTATSEIIVPANSYEINFKKFAPPVLDVNYIGSQSCKIGEYNISPVERTIAAGRRFTVRKTENYERGWDPSVPIFSHFVIFHLYDSSGASTAFDLTCELENRDSDLQLSTVSTILSGVFQIEMNQTSVKF